MGIDKEPSPWSRGDQYEKEVGSDAMNQIRSGVQQYAAAERDEKDVIDRVARELPTIGLSAFEWVQKEPEKRREEVREMVKLHEGNSIEEEFSVDPLGCIRLTDAQRSDLKVLLGAVKPSLVNKERHVFFAPDDIRKAAAELVEAYPEISVEFRENRTKGTFSYIASIKSNEK